MKTNVFLIVLALLLAYPGRLPAQQKPLKVGVIAPLSGDIASWGQDVRNALLFAKEKLGTAKLDLVFEDDQCLGKNAVSAAQKLISIDRVNFGMVVCTESMLAAAPLFERAKIVVIAPVASGAAVSKAGDYIFRTWPSDAGAARLLYRYVATRHRAFGIISEERGYAQELTSAFLEAARSGALKTATASFTSDTSDFKSVLLKLRSEAIEGLFINTNSERAFVNVLKQQHELGLRIPTYGSYYPGGKSFPALAGAPAEGIIFVDSPSAQSALTPAGQELFGEFVARFGAPQSASFVMPSTFEVFRLIQAAAASGRDARAFLYEGSFSGIFGKYSFDPNGDIQGVRHVLKVLEHGEPRVLEFTE
jgi:branched-chain amino acid transport system substrate-binding protein